MDLGLKGKRIVVTGGGAGIGAAISMTLAEEGAAPLIVARRTPDGDFMDRLRDLAPAEFILADLSKDEVCRAAVAQALSVALSHCERDGVKLEESVALPLCEREGVKLGECVALPHCELEGV